MVGRGLRDERASSCRATSGTRSVSEVVRTGYGFDFNKRSFITCDGGNVAINNQHEYLAAMWSRNRQVPQPQRAAG
jgi:hypothetical protein